MTKQVLAQKINKKGYLRKITWLMTAVLIFMMTGNCAAAAEITQSWTDNNTGKCIAYVRGLPDVQEVSGKIGTMETGEIAASRLQDSQDAHIMTYILIDNSHSINAGNQEKIRQVVTSIVQNPLAGEEFKFATFDQEVHVLNDFSQQYEAVLGSLNGLTYEDRTTYVMKAIEHVFSEMQQDNSYNYKRLLISSDGGEGSSGGDLTLQEALNYIDKNPFPIYTMGCRWAGQPEWALDNFAALARQSGGFNTILDDKDPGEIVEAMAQDRDVYRFEVPVPAEYQDGSTRSLELTIKTSQGDVSVSRTVMMPQNVLGVQTPEPDEPEPTPSPTATPSPSPSPTVTPTSVPTTSIAPPDPEKGFFEKYWLALLILLLILLAIIILIIAIVRKKKKERERITESVQDFVKNRQTDTGEETVIFREGMDGTGSYTSSTYAPGAEGYDTGGYDTGGYRAGGFDTGGFEEDVTMKMFTESELNRELERQIYIRLEDMNRPGVIYNVPLKGGKLVAGRSSTKSDLALREDPTVSGRHFAITASGSRLFIEDLGSRNGTWVNRERLHEKHELHGGDIIRAGDTELMVDISS